MDILGGFFLVLHVLARALLPSRLEVQDHKFVTILHQHVAVVLPKAEVLDAGISQGFYLVNQFQFVCLGLELSNHDV